MVKVVPFLALFSLVAYASATPALIQLNQKYLVSRKEASFLRAFLTCTSLGFKLATVSNQEDFVQLNKTLKTNDAHWLGGAYARNGVFESRWIWLDSEEELTFTNWFEAEPNVFDGDNCLLMNSEGFWGSNDCNAKYPFVCQI